MLNSQFSTLTCTIGNVSTCHGQKPDSTGCSASHWPISIHSAGICEANSVTVQTISRRRVMGGGACMAGCWTVSAQCAMAPEARRRGRLASPALVGRERGREPLVPRVGLEPTPLSRTDFESVAATDYATEAGDAAGVSTCAGGGLSHGEGEVWGALRQWGLLSSSSFQRIPRPCRRT